MKKLVAIAVLTGVLNLAVIGSTALAVTGTTSNANNEGSNLVAFKDRRTSRAAGAFVGSDGTVGPTFQISTQGGVSSPVAATDGVKNLVVWAQVGDYGCLSSSIHGAIVESNGFVSGPFPISSTDLCDVVDALPSSPYDMLPRVGFDGENYFVVWHGSRGTEASIFGARVTPNGTVLDPGGVLLVPVPESSLTHPRLAFDGVNFLVVYNVDMDGLCFFCFNEEIHATRVNTAGPPVSLDPEGLIVFRGGGNPSFGNVVFDGQNWVVFWTLQEISAPAGLRAARINRAGVNLDPSGVLVVLDAKRSRIAPAVAFDGGRTLIAWNDSYGNDGSYASTRVTIVRTGLSPAVEVVVPLFSLPLDDQPDAALSADGFLVVGGSYSEVAGSRITRDGLPLDPQPFLISAPDTTPPQTEVFRGPSTPSNLSSATFEFSSNEGGSSFECRLDSGAFSSCGSPVTYSGLADGSHTFEVAATDPAGNADETPASWSWVVDTSAAETTITAGPATPTNQTFATFSVSSNETGSSFECRLDDASFSLCSSPITYSGLTDGSHAFESRAIDSAGNIDPTPSSWSWVVVTVAPETPTLSSPADGSSTDNSKPTFDWSDVTDGSTPTYQLQVDNSGVTFPSPEINQTGISPSSFTPSSALSTGTYSWHVRALDGAGNASEWSAVFTVTITAPPGSIAGKVTNLATKKPISGATVDCAGAGSATTGSDGSYSLSGVAPGSYTCTASASGFKSVSKSVKVTSGSTATVNFALRKA